MPDFNVEFKKDVSFLHVINDLEKVITELGTKLNLEESLSNVSTYPAFTVTGTIDSVDIYYPAKLETPRNIQLTSGATGIASFDGSSDISIAVTVDPSLHVHTKPYIITDINVTTSGWTQEGSGDGIYYTKVIEIANMLETDEIIAQLNLLAVTAGTQQENAITDFAKFRIFIPTNGYLTIHAHEVPIYTVPVKLFRFI